MAFVRPVAEKLAMYHVETNVGTEYVPEYVCNPDRDPNDGEVTESGRDELWAYLEGSEIHDVERKEGWYSRLSAPGYMDCTDWMGPYPTAKEALDAVKETYEVDDNGDDLSTEEE